MKLPLAMFVAGLLALGTGACGSSDIDDDGPGSDACLVGDPDCADDPSQGMCPPDVTDCIDTVDDEAVVDIEVARARAAGLLGAAEAEVPADVRIGRIGDTHQPLTEDHRVGRLTVAIEDTDGSGPRVVEVVVEVPDGIETYELTPS